MRAGSVSDGGSAAPPSLMLPARIRGGAAPPDGQRQAFDRRGQQQQVGGTQQLGSIAAVAQQPHPVADAQLADEPLQPRRVSAVVPFGAGQPADDVDTALLEQGDRPNGRLLPL